MHGEAGRCLNTSMELVNLKAEDAPIDHHFGAGVYAKQVTLANAGTRLVGHRHKHDHLSILARGSVTLSVNGKQSTHHAPACLLIAAGEVHELVTLEPGTVWFCIHAVPEELQGDVSSIDAALIVGE